MGFFGCGFEPCCAGGGVNWACGWWGFVWRGWNFARGGVSHGDGVGNGAAVESAEHEGDRIEQSSKSEAEVYPWDSRASARGFKGFSVNWNTSRSKSNDWTLMVFSVRI